MAATHEQLEMIKVPAAREKYAIPFTSMERLLARRILSIQQNAPGGDRWLFDDELAFWKASIGTFEERAEKLLNFRRERGRL